MLVPDFGLGDIPHILLGIAGYAAILFVLWLVGHLIWKVIRPAWRNIRHRRQGR
jgi:hypothetical protein